MRANQRSKITDAVAARSKEASVGTAKGREAIETILSAAEEVLISVGYANFTARRIADAAGIALGNLTYHFPTMNDLTRALVEYVLGRYLGRWAAFLEGMEAPGAERPSFDEIMKWLITDAVEPKTSRLFRELWAMSTHSKFAADAMDDFYSQAVQAAAKVARVLFPHLSQSEALNAAYLMAVISEGHIVLFGTLPKAAERVQSVQRLATRALETMFDHQAAAAGSGSRRARSQKSLTAPERLARKKLA